jgi:mono/diheme cytochrome c family protein
MGGKRPIAAIAIILALILIGVGYGLTHANISALPDPGFLETSIATKVKDWLTARSAQAVARPSIQDDAAAVSKGKALYGMQCAPCHGQGGHNPTPIGQAMYPRAPDLGSGVVQNLSDRELFWTVKNGVRLTGMPGFARLDTDREIWQLVFFIRSLRTPKN